MLNVELEERTASVFSSGEIANALHGLRVSHDTAAARAPRQTRHKDRVLMNVTSPPDGLDALRQIFPA
jgi:hypothetical protein